MFKKLAGVVLSAAMLAGVLSGCAGAENNSTQAGQEAENPKESMSASAETGSEGATTGEQVEIDWDLEKI